MTSPERPLLPETDLIARARQGDPAAWEILLAEHQQAVFRLAYLLVGDADDAQDVAQESFIRAYRSFGRFDADRPLRPWLLRIAANLARNRRRSLGRYVAAVQRAWLAEPRVAERAPVESLTAQQMAAQELWKAVRRLGSVDQEVIYLRFFIELPEADIAAALRVAPGTVKSRLHRALHRLRAVVEAEFPGLREKIPV
jgi:RNA polymerase sigma-70 factor (ECF subfamily)